MGNVPEPHGGHTPPPAAPTVVSSRAGEKGLKTGALGLVSSVAIGLASTAPAYSLAATLGIIVVGVGLQAPIITILAFVPMLLIAYAYKELNASDPDCGTTFTWGARAFGPRTGWMGGWGIVIADIIVMANLAQIAGCLRLPAVRLRRPGREHRLDHDRRGGLDHRDDGDLLRRHRDLGRPAALAAVHRGRDAGAARHHGPGQGVRGPPPDTAIRISGSWFNPFEVTSTTAFTAGILAAVFIYWGWDTAVSVNEETEDAARTPGRAAVISTVLLLIIYALVATSAQAFAGIGTDGIGLGNEDNVGDVLSSLGGAVFGSAGLGWFLTKLLIFMVLTSSAASTQTTILPTARTTFSMAAHRAVPRQFARVHPRHRTPTWSTIAMGLASIAFYVLLTAISGNVLADSIASVGLAIAFYYGLTGFACVWYYRRVLTRSVRDFVFKGLMPLLGGLLLLYFFCYGAFDVYADPDYGSTSIDLPLFGETGGVTVIGIGALLLGVVLMLVQWAVDGSWFRHPDVPVEAADPADAPRG